MTTKLLQLWAFVSLLCFLFVVPPRLVLPFSSLLLLLILLDLLQSHLVSFICPLAPPVISHSSITCLRSSFLLHSLHLFSPSSFQYSLALVSFPHLNLANILLSFHFQRERTRTTSFFTETMRAFIFKN